MELSECLSLDGYPQKIAAIAGQMRAAADDAAEDMSARLAAEGERARQAHDRLTEATTAHAAEIELISRQAHERIAAAQTERDTAVQATEAARDAALTEAKETR